MASSRLTISTTQIFSAAARIVPPHKDLAYQKYDTQTTPKKYPRGVQFYNHRSAQAQQHGALRK